MKEIIPGYFIPIWQEIMLKKRKTCFKIINELTLIPTSILESNSYIYQNKEEYLKNYIDKTSAISIYFDYKYCVISLSKLFYKKVCKEGEKCLQDLDLNKSIKGSMLNICISFEDKDTFVSKRWSEGIETDYLFLNIGINYLQKRIYKKKKKEIEKLLSILVINDLNLLESLSEYQEIINIIKKYQTNHLIKNWYRTYQEYINYSDMFHLAISENHID